MDAAGKKKRGRTTKKSGSNYIYVSIFFYFFIKIYCIAIVLAIGKYTNNRAFVGALIG